MYITVYQQFILKSKVFFKTGINLMTYSKKYTEFNPGMKSSWIKTHKTNRTSFFNLILNEFHYAYMLFVLKGTK